MKRRLWIIAKVGVLSLFSVTTLFPFAWVLLSSFKSTAEIYRAAFKLPTTWLLSNYSTAWVGANIPVAFFNSMLYSLTALLITSLIAGMAAYAIMRVYYSHAGYIFFSLGITMPLYGVIIPLNILFGNLGLKDTRIGIILAYTVISMSLSFFILSAHMRTIPKEIDEAASIDGCSRARCFFSIIMPLCKSAFAAAATLQFINCWNDLLLCLTLSSKQSLRTLNLAVYSMRSSYVIDYGVITAGIILLVLPAMLMYIIFQEQIIKGVLSGAVKG